MENQPTTLDKAVKISVIVGALIVALSVAYYLVIYIPKRDKAKLEQQTQQLEQQAQLQKTNADNLAKCLNAEELIDENNHQALTNALSNSKTSGLDVQGELDRLDKTYQERKADCFKKYPQ